MKVSLQWVREFTTIELSDDEIITRVGERLGAVEAIERWGLYFDERIIVAEITEAKDHPNADRLGLYTISIGNETRQLIAGDKNLKVGDRVGYIQPGAIVPSSAKAGDPFIITEREMRGEVSQGMLGSGAELLFNDNHERVQVLDTSVPIGTPLQEAYKLDDIVIDIENKMFTHRPDCFGIVGVAREIAGIQNIAYKSPEWFLQSASIEENATVLPLTVDNQVENEVRRFSMVALSNIQVSDSPLLMQSYLLRCGMRPINSIVDITNFVMHLTAQPLHAFDYDKVAALSDGDGAQIIVRKPQKDESLVLLDGREITPHPDAILIATNKKAIAVGGCMGGADTEVDKSTKNIILEVANFDMYSIRRTSFLNGLFTDAVTRFNKGQGLEQIDRVASYATTLLREQASAQFASSFIDIYPMRHIAPQIEVNRGFINNRLAAEFTSEEIAALLRNVEITVDVQGDSLTITPPFWRMDLHIPEDIVEEIGRLYGFDNLPVALPFSSTTPSYISNELQLAQSIRDILSRGGANEVLSYNFVSEMDYKKSGLSFEHAYKIRNALAPELQRMRTVMLPSLFEKIYPNIRQNHTEFVLFEIGKVHTKQDIGDDELPVEKRRLTLSYASVQHQNGSPFFMIKKYLTYLLETLGIKDVTYIPCSKTIESDFTELAALFTDKRAGYVMVGDQVLGIIGEAAPQVRKNYKLPENSAFVEIDLAVIEQHVTTQSQYKQLSKYPSITEDITLKTAQEIPFSDINAVLLAFAENEPLVQSYQTQSIYQRQDESTKNTSFSITFQSLEKTLTKQEVATSISRLVALANEKIKAEQV